MTQVAIVYSYSLQKSWAKYLFIIWYVFIILQHICVHLSYSLNVCIANWMGKIDRFCFQVNIQCDIIKCFIFYVCVCVRNKGNNYCEYICGKIYVMYVCVCVYACIFYWSKCCQNQLKQKKWVLAKGNWIHVYMYF